MEATTYQSLDPKLLPGSTFSNFEVIRAELVDELEGAVYEFIHTPSGAHLLWLATPDTNKAFAIGFGTAPTNSTGVFHILEHSVLCGSKKFPVKEPFVDLIKTSMQTFLNAFTFSDKTMYPVSSTNIYDLENLMEVYLDAVFNPRIYEKKQIFEQEGWHLELNDNEDGEEPIYNGVVYNEMKGALSDPDDFLVNKLDALLFPDTAYRYVSGGAPKDIPQLTYEEFLDTHARHYQLKNSKTMLYGDLDILRELAFLDARFAEVPNRGAGDPNPLLHQSPVTPDPQSVTMSTDSSNAAVALGYVIGEATECEKLLATSILWDALAGTNEAPLKKAVLESGMCDDFMLSLQNHKLQPYLLLLAKGIKQGQAHNIAQLINTVCADLVANGIDKERLRASIAFEEFSLREGNRGFGSDGIGYAVDVFSTWLYSEDDPVCALRFESALTNMKEGLESGYFEKLLQEILLESEHHAQIELIPEDVDAARDEKETLDALYKTLTPQDKENIKSEVETLRQIQEAEDTPEDLAKLPRLTIDDLGEGVAEQPLEHTRHNNFELLYHDLPTKKIVYARQYFSLAHVAFEDISALSLLSALFGKLGTDTYSAADLDTLLTLKLGNLSSNIELYSSDDDPSHFDAYFKVSASALSENIKELAELPAHIWAHTNFRDEVRVQAILQQERLAYASNLVNSGHSVASARILSQISPASRVADEYSGINNYLYLKDLLDNWDDKKEAFFTTLERLQKQVFSSCGLHVSLTCSTDDRDKYLAFAKDFGLSPLDDASQQVTLEVPKLEPQNEAFIISGMVNYVAEGRADPTPDFDTLGAWTVSSTALSFDYLWNEVRVKGGAYGCGFKTDPMGNQIFLSYRDPSIDATLERYDGAKAWLSTWKDTHNALEGYIVSSVARHDKPLKSPALAKRQDMLYFKKRQADYLERVRKQILSVTEADVQATANTLFTSDSGNTIVCVVGTKAAIDASDVKFARVIDLTD